MSSAMETQIVQDLLPGTGALGSVPQHHNYKRAVVRSAPKNFTVEVLPPRKFGSGHCYGLRVLPLGKDAEQSSASSTKSGSSNTEYEVWRRWEDCLWFQDMLETEYKLMARTKRTRLAQGKGVKKDGVYLHSDQAASFESLPPGPDVHTIAKDVHEILPKLTKKGTLFRAGPATIEQRNREFSALIQALFDDEVPTLVKELRENRIIRDFFGYWRRDKDHDRKASESASNRSSRVSISSSAFSMYFSASNISLQLPNAFADFPPPSPSIHPSIKERPMSKGKGRVITKSASFSSSSSSSSRDTATPITAPAGLGFTVSENGALIPTSPVSDDEGHFRVRSPPLSAPARGSTSRWSRSLGSRKTGSVQTPDSASESEDNAIIFVPESPWVDSFSADVHRPGGLESLPEEQELVPCMTGVRVSPGDLPPPVRRPRNNSCPDPHNRNGLVFMTLPQPHAPAPSVERDNVSVISDMQGDPILPPESVFPETPLSNTNSSRHTSMALSNFSGELSRRSSWRTSVDSATSVPPGSPVRDSCIDLDDVLCPSPVSADSPLLNGSADAIFRPKHAPRSSVATMNSIMSNSSVDAVLPRRPKSPASSGPSLRRSLSTGSRVSRRSPPIPSSPTLSNEELWYEGGEEMIDEELLDAYFYDPSLRSSTTPPTAGHETPRRERVSQFITQQISTPEHFPKPFQNRPPGQFHLPWSPTTAKPQHMSVASLSPNSPSASADTFTIKAIRHDSIILLRASHSMSLPDVRNKIREKFASQDGTPLTDGFTIGFHPAITSAEVKPPSKTRPRSQSTSAIGALDNLPRLRFITNDEDWQAASAGCTGKLTLHIFDRF